MSYFEIHMQPIGGGSSDCVTVQNFHPKWKEAARKIREGRIVRIMEEKAGQVSKWSGIPLIVTFNDYALNHISLSGRAGLDLWESPNNDSYRSHNVHSFQEAGVVVAVIAEYIHWLNFALKDL